MRKYLLNASLLGAVASGWNVVQTTRHGPRDWRLVLSWAIWGMSIAVAVGTVQAEAKEAQARQLELDQ